jgi:hypothetical protein
MVIIIIKVNYVKEAGIQSTCKILVWTLKDPFKQMFKITMKVFQLI